MAADKANEVLSQLSDGIKGVAEAALGAVFGPDQVKGKMQQVALMAAMDSKSYAPSGGRLQFERAFAAAMGSVLANEQEMQQSLRQDAAGGHIFQIQG